MKALKLFTLVLAICAFTSSTNAQTVRWLGGGSSALFQELGQAAFDVVNLAPTALTPGNGCLWSHGGTSAGGNPDITANDNRAGVGTSDRGNFFVAYDGANPGCAGGTPAVGAHIYAYIQLDSTIGNRCYFENDGSGAPGCVLGLLNMANAASTGTSVITTQADVPAAVLLNNNIVTALQASPHFFIAGTDIRPEDAKFATTRALFRCDQLTPRQYFNNDSYWLPGWGYQTANPNVGNPILGTPAYGGGTFATINFNIVGNDPITTAAAVPSYSVTTVGAQPIVVALSPLTSANVQGASDITVSTLAMFYEGLLGRTNDLLGTTNAPEVVQVLLREPLSGTYNTFEYSIPQSTQFHAGQEFGNCSGQVVASNPLSIPSAGGLVPGAQRVRVIGTGKMTSNLQTPVSGFPTLGYFFWSQGNAKPLTNVKYLKVNGIDPLLANSSYASGGIMPGSGAAYGGFVDPGIGAVTFTGLNAGDYPIWSPLRLIAPPGDPGTADIVTQLNANVNPTQHDYIAPNNMKIWHSHFFINGEAAAIPVPANGTAVGTNVLCAGGTAEQGGDVGGSTLLIINNANFCHDLPSTSGKLNLTF